MIGTLNEQQIDSLLRSELVGRLGCHAHGTTYVVPVFYYYDRECIYGYTKEGLKTKITKENPSVCFQVDRIENLANWQSVIIQGEFQVLKGSEVEQAQQFLTNRMLPFKTGESSLPKFSMEKLPSLTKPFTQFITYRIQIREKYGRFEKD
ncbi:MAG: pyridoxamine 5'-phosphate oxidase family protein [Algoriphagus sp.]|uniref:pyridoxamine 5'-phosphate oxidase family protein n=1 Tax=Algoriphagus sp. TaxID=1872435 RepID=UPI00262531D4|nr:pyridoxamine 5'-phosphate oxidase family protein [Algoriphagus sp.]MDG1276518.1 pyridoxamine 5'-phosphate oxidase family protein [Algoriphagus sp.]